MSCAANASAFRFGSPDEAIAAALSLLSPVDIEPASLGEATGRFLAAPLVATRDSPACDVSAMDGFACRLADINESGAAAPLAGEARIGAPPGDLAPGTAVKIFTGSPVPRGADVVIKREDAIEETNRLRLRPDAKPLAGEYIRRKGENGRAGARILEAGAPLHAAAIAAAASIGLAELSVHRRVRVGVLVTGDELSSPLPRGEGPGAPAGRPASIEPYRLFDSNGPTLAAMFGPLPWIALHTPRRVRDEPDAIQSTLASALQQSDAVIATGGVSAGDYDFLPRVVGQLGGETIFYGLPVRPGKPVLVAACRGKPVFALPGNPLSVMVSARWLVAPCLAKLAGSIRPDGHRPFVTVKRPDARTLPLYWFRPVRLTGPGEAELTANVSSGDVVGPARSDGFILVPPGQMASGLSPFYAWSPT